MIHYSSSILEELLELFEGWSLVFPSKPTSQRARQLAMNTYMNPARQTISNTIFYAGRDQEDWSADYKLFSRSKWKQNKLFEPVMKFFVENHLRAGWKNKPLVSAIDTSQLKKTGKKIPHTQYYRDPLSPPFHLNLQWGQRVLQISALVPQNDIQKGAARGIPLSLKICPRPTKPKKKATEEEKKEYQKLLEQYNLSKITIDEVCQYRKDLDEIGAKEQILLMEGDGSFSTQKIYTHPWEMVAWLCRTRKDLAVYYPYQSVDKTGQLAKDNKKGRGRYRKYGEKAPTPEELRQDDKIAWRETAVYVGEHCCRVKYKSLGKVLWKTAQGKEVRILVINGLPYRPAGAKKKSYREPAYLVYLGPDSLADEFLVQWYIWRTQIEVNFRDEKQVFGIGEAQVWAEGSVLRYPAFATALYSLLLVAAIKANGHQRGSFYLRPPKWNRRRPEQRPSILEILRKLRAEMTGGISEGLRKNFEGFVVRMPQIRKPQNSVPIYKNRRLLCFS